ncbi:hypothetical protein [Algoriphagus sp.]|uniref:hypothetical protein n=1 Tax=Algoriphagus sp. TaxID=1872435 RepID=UPI0032890C34
MLAYIRFKFESPKNSEYENSRRGPCEEYLDNSLKACRNGALIAAGACGLLSPTILPALGCGLSMWLGELVCIELANDDFETCKTYEVL